MKYLFTLLLASLLFVCNLSAQSRGQAERLPIEIEGKALGEVYRYDGKRMNIFKLNKVLRQDRDARKVNNKARLLLLVAIPSATAGGLMIGGAGSSVPYGGDYDYTMLSGGMGFLTLGLYTAYMSDNLRKKAIRLYNNNLAGLDPGAFRPELHFAVEQSGMGVSIKF